ncbi:MAG TPA: hypothetical protein VIL86_18505 [Tepidisphaeraceae bacterium]
MTLVVPLSPEIEAKLRQRAAAEGQDLAEYASKLLEHAVTQPALAELLAPLRQQFAASSTTDEALVAQITKAREAYRNQQ